MKLWRLATLGIILAAVVAPLGSGNAAAPRPLPADAIPDQVIVQFDGPIPADVASRVGGSIVHVDDSVLHFVTVKTSGVDASWSLIDRASVWSDVRSVTFNGKVSMLMTPNDPGYAQQWGPATVNLPTAWDTTTGSHDVMLAILDVGIDNTHPDLAANYCVRGPDFTGWNWQSLHYHATHVMGIAAGVINNGVGIAGAGQSCVMDVRVLDPSGSGQWDWVASGIVWAADHGAQIESMSLGGGGGAPVVADAVKHAYDDKGVLIVAAAGNSGCGSDTTATDVQAFATGKDGGDKTLYPARYPQVMAVAALSQGATPQSPGIASFSSCGREVEIAAPGAAVYSSLPGNSYGYLSGTSMATPHVSGVAALVLSAHPTLTAAELRCTLTLTASSFAGQTPLISRKVGAGTLNAAAALAGPVTDANQLTFCTTLWNQKHTGN